MKKYTTTLLLLISISAFSQKYISTQTDVSFYSEAPVENIEAKNTKSKSIFDLNSGEIVISIPISSFVFDKSLMQEHFNEKYMESNKYPKATFNGKVLGFDVNKQGTQKVKAKGKLTIHGVEQEIEHSGELSLSEGKVTLNHAFEVALKDYKIKIPKVLWQNIAEVIEVKLTFEYAPYEK